MDSDFRLGLRSSFNNVKVKKDDSEQVIVEPTRTVDIVVPKKVIVEEKKETFIEPEKVKIDEKKEEIVPEVTEKTEFESMDLSEDELLEIKKLALKDLYGDPAALGMHIKSNHLISLGSISETNWNYDITSFTDSTTVAGYLKNKVLSVAKFIGLS